MDLSAAALAGLATVAAAAGGALAWLFKQPGSILAEQRATIDRERAERRAAEQAAEGLRSQLLRAEHEVAKLRRRLVDYQHAADALTSDDAPTRLFWNGFHCGIAVTSNRDGGTLLWVNRYVCDRMGYSREELLELGWARLIHPDYVRHAQRAEAGAHDAAVAGFVALYRRSDSIGGGWIRWRWDCRRYDDRGFSTCRLTDEGIVADPLRVLLVEDQEFFRKALRVNMETSGVTVAGETDSGDEAVRLALELRPDVVLMDLKLSGATDGLEATQRILAAWPEARIVVLTGSESQESVAVAKAAGVRDVLLKGGLLGDELLARLSRAAR